MQSELQGTKSPLFLMKFLNDKIDLARVCGISQVVTKALVHVFMSEFEVPIIYVGVVEFVDKMPTVLSKKQAEDSKAGLFAGEVILVFEGEFSMLSWRHFVQ
jgi:hypothetical protein